MKYKILLLILTLLVSNKLFAQDHMILSAGDTPQRNLSNPAFMPRSSFLSVPIVGGVDINVSNPFSYGDVLGKNSNNDNVVNNNSLLASINGDKPFLANANLDLIFFGINVGHNGMITFSERIRVTAGFNYPHDVMSMTLNNPLSKDIKNFNTTLGNNALGWSETAIGYSHKINKNWQVGGKVKYLMGAYSSNGGKTDINIQQRVSDYTISGNIDLYFGNIDIVTGDFTTSNITKNHGAAFDIGAMYTTNNGKLRLGAAVTDIGFIGWNGIASSRIISKDPTKKATYKGGGNLNDLKGKSIGKHLGDELSKMLKSMDLDTIRGAKFTTVLPTTINISGEYSIDSRKLHNVSLNLIGVTSYHERFNYGITAGYTYRTLNNLFRLMGSLSHRSTSPLSIGLGGMINTRGFQFFAMADMNVVGLAQNNMCWKGINSLGLRWGLNIMLGKGRFKDDRF